MKTVEGIFLILLAMGLAVVLFPIGVLFAILSGGATYDYFYRIAKGIDELGNTVMGELFNLVLVNKNGYPFGLDGETISSALGKNVERGTLKVAGRLLNWLLDKIQKNHAILSINNNVNNEP